MPIALHSFKVDNDGQVRASFTFYARSEAAARELKRTRIPTGWAAEDDIEIVEEIDLLPEANEQDLLEFLELDEDEDSGEILGG